MADDLGAAELLAGMAAPAVPRAPAVGAARPKKRSGVDTAAEKVCLAALAMERRPGRIPTRQR